MKNFLCGLVGAVALAYLAPWLGVKGGPVLPEVTINVIGVATIFFGSGLSLQTSQLGLALRSWRVSACVQLFHFAACPAIFAAVAAVCRKTSVLSPRLASGLLVLGCLPPPISSAVILTAVSGGNAAVSVVNSSLGSLLGVFLTPSLIVAISGVSAEISATNLAATLGSTVLFPLMLGQVARRFGIRKLPGYIGECILIAIIWHAFSETFSREVQVQPGDVFRVIGCLLAVQLCLVATVIIFASGPCGGRQSRADVTALAFTCSHKSLTLGMTILMTMYGTNPDFIIYALPLLCYHPMQIFLGSVLLVPWFKGYIDDEDVNDDVDLSDESWNQRTNLDEIFQNHPVSKLRSRQGKVSNASSV